MSSRHTVPMRRLASLMTATPSPTHVPPHLVVMILIFVGAVVIGYLLLPDENERIAMLEGDGHDRQALGLLEQRFASGDRGQRTLFQMRNLYEEKGDIARARQMLELLAEARPRDANVQRHLAELYRSTQDERAYTGALEKRLAARPSQPVCKELIGIYRGKGDFDAEQRTLSYCRSKGYRRTDDIIRLAHLTAVDGNTIEAAALLKSVDDRRHLRRDTDRLMLFATLVEADDAVDAKRRAARWFKGSKDDTLVLQMIDTLAGSKRNELAAELADEVGRPGDAITLAIAELMLDNEDIDAARISLAEWLGHAKLGDGELAQRFVRAALDAEDPLLAYKAAKSSGLARLPQYDLISLAEALSAIDRPDESRSVRALIEPDAIAANLLLVAAVEVEQGKAEAARQLLSRVQVKALEDWRLALWARLMASTGRQETAEKTLRDIAAEVRADDGASESATDPAETAAGTPRLNEPPPLKSAAAPAAVDRQAHTKRRTPRRSIGSQTYQRKLLRRHRGRLPPRRSRWRRPPTTIPAPPTASQTLQPPGVMFPAPR
ncbi:MAG: tetratricopeptide repeat protein [Hyphomicrobiaceae bacterium]